MFLILFYLLIYIGSNKATKITATETEEPIVHKYCFCWGRQSGKTVIEKETALAVKMSKTTPIFRISSEFPTCRKKKMHCLRCCQITNCRSSLTLSSPSPKSLLRSLLLPSVSQVSFRKEKENKKKTFF